MPSHFAINFAWIPGMGGCKIKEMLQELKNVRQVNGEGPRRWFVDDEIELILWYDFDKKLEGFQICYDKLAGTRTITWKRMVATGGESKSVLISDGPYNRGRLLALVERSIEGLDQPLRTFILDRLTSHGG